MAFGGGSGGGGAISTATDVAFNTVNQDDVISYNTGVGKWQNSGLSGKVAMATRGGAEGLQTLTSSGSAAINLANANVFRVTLNANTTFTFTGAVASAACSFSLYLVQGTGGSRTATWPASVRWSGGAPALSSAVGALDIVVFESIDGGTTWYGSLVGTNFQ